MKKKRARDEEKTKEELIEELKVLRQKLKNDSDSVKEKMAQEALRESEKKFRVLVEKSLAGVYLIQDGIFKYINARNAEIHGYTVEEIIEKKGPEDLIFPEDWPLVKENIQKRILGLTESMHFEFRGISKRGEVIDVEVYGSRTIYQGQPALIGTLLDITERKRAEKLLKQAEARYRSIFENAIEGIFQITPQGKFIVVNPALAKMLGYDSRDGTVPIFEDIGYEIYVEPARRSEFMSILEKDGVALGFECQFYKKDKSKVWVLISARAVCDTDDKILYYEGTIEDITEKKKVVDELRLVNELNRAIIDNAPVAIFTLDRKGVFKSVNPALAILSGLGPDTGEKLIGFNWIRNSYTIKSGLAAYIEKGLDGEPFQLWDFPFITYKGNKNHYMDFKGVPLRGKDGAVEGLLCIIEDTTDRVKTRAKLMQEAKISAIGRLAAGVAHELNNPLATLVAYAELASDCLESFREAKDKNLEMDDLIGYLDIIQTQAFRCKNVVNDILNLTRKGGLEIVDVDINILLDNIIALTDINKAKATIEKDLHARLPSVKGDVSALRQVFVNLISNAIDAVERRTDAAIWVKTGLKDNRVRVEIGDNGIGIPDSLLDKIFEPFFTTKEPRKGLGLGLSLCYEFLNNLEGTIEVKSKPGFGTTFFVTLPTQLAQKGGKGTRHDSSSYR